MMKRKLLMYGTFVLIYFAIASFAVEDTTKEASPENKTSGNVSRTATVKDTLQTPALLANSESSQSTDMYENISYRAGIRLNPRAVTFVEDYMDKYGEDLLKMKTWAMPYFDMIDKVMTQYGLPHELKYLAVIESKLKPTARSRAGAVGPWQLMPTTARLLGLKVTRTVDERKDYRKSTRAAARYLNELHQEFDDWLLAIAAYNGGPGSVYSAIRKSGSRNFWDLQYYLPTETRNHVKKFIATHYVFEGQGGITTLTKAEVEDHIEEGVSSLLNRQMTAEEEHNAKSMVVSGKYQAAAIAKVLLMDIDDFNRYNPDFDRVIATAEAGYELKLPADKMNKFITSKYQILNESVQLLLSSATTATTGK